MTLAELPRRDLRARAHLDRSARFARPVVLARERTLPVAGELGPLLPGAGLTRGSVVALEGRLGSGVTSIAYELAAVATRAGEWAAVVDPEGTLGGLAAAEAGVALERFAVVRRVPPARWTTVVAALLDGVSVVVAAVPSGVRIGDARRLVARTRERGAVLVVTGAEDAWPVEAALRIRVEGQTWRGLNVGYGLLDARTLQVRVEGRGSAARARTGALARAG